MALIKSLSQLSDISSVTQPFSDLVAWNVVFPNSPGSMPVNQDSWNWVPLNINRGSIHQPSAAMHSTAVMVSPLPVPPISGVWPRSRPKTFWFLPIKPYISINHSKYIYSKALYI